MTSSEEKEPPEQNCLAGEASPYLRQHAGNPVHWRPWSAAALAEARALDRPILLSIGYAACHWCHVMAHESFENPGVAAVMNRLFVNIKVDREERPDIDQVYMAALAAMGEQGGWPLTMFLTPEGKPFWGGTYFPPEPRYGRPGFVQVLEAVDKAWREKKESLQSSANDLLAHVGANLAPARDHASLKNDSLAELANGIAGMIDGNAGGLRGAPKFPNAPFMTTLWLSWLENGTIDHRNAVLSSLEHMLAGGIYDHVGGGLARYSTDADWLVPHFEKMLYDNAQLIRLANWAHAETGNKLFRVRIEETVGWLLREMRTGDGAFASSLDADSDGEEGLFYTWTRPEIETVLDADADLFFSHFSLARPPAWEGKPILCQTLGQQSSDPGETNQLKSFKKRLLSARGSRVRPGRDDKVLSDWNGLMITSLAEAGRSLSRPQWIEAAKKAFGAIADSVRDGRLPHSTLGGSRQFPALSSDYAAMILAAVALYEATGDSAYTETALALLDQLDRWHGDGQETGHYLTASDSIDVPLRIRGDVDEAIPSATSLVIEAMTKLAAVIGDADLQARAWRVAEHAMGRASQQRYGQAGIVNACALLLGARKLILVENPDEPHLVTIANRNPDPRRVDLVVAVGQGEPPALTDGVLPPTDRPAAYLCQGQTCLPAVTEPEMLELLLRPRTARS